MNETERKERGERGPAHLFLLYPASGTGLVLFILTPFRCEDTNVTIFLGDPGGFVGKLEPGLDEPAGIKGCSGDRVSGPCLSQAPLCSPQTVECFPSGSLSFNKCLRACY